jgi:hypothetical protein
MLVIDLQEINITDDRKTIIILALPSAPFIV